jgi:hypothetical protein
MTDHYANCPFQKPPRTVKLCDFCDEGIDHWHGCQAILKGVVCSICKPPQPTESTAPFKWPSDVKPSEFGVSVPISVSELYSDMQEKLYSDMQEKLKSAAYEWIDHHSHLAFGVETMEGCKFCSWAWRFYTIWSTIAFALETCKGCGRVMYECGTGCEFWYDY